jgi:hypothetical protein
VPSSDPVKRLQDILDNIERINRFTAGLNLASAFFVERPFKAAMPAFERAFFAALTVAVLLRVSRVRK